MKNSSTFLDLCIVDDRSKIICFDQQDVNFLSAHDLISVTYDIKINRRQCRFIICRDFRNFDQDKFEADVNNFT